MNGLKFKSIRGVALLLVAVHVLMTGLLWLVSSVIGGDFDEQPILQRGRMVLVEMTSATKPQ